MMLPRSPRPAQRSILDDVIRTARMHDDWYTELRGLGPERIVLRQRQILTVDVSADGGTAQTEAFDAILQLLHSQIGMLQRDRRHRHEPIGMGRHPFGQSFVLLLDDAPGQLAIGRIPPEAVDGQRLNVDARPVHELQALRSQDLVSAPARPLLERRPFDDIRDVDDAVTMNVDHADALAGDRHLPPRGRRLPRRHTLEECVAPGNAHPRRRTRESPDEVSAIGHRSLLQRDFVPLIPG